jgi:hypothetical protein
MTKRNLVLMLAGSLALGYLAIMVIGNSIVEAQGRGDTPVVLIGGSVTLGERSSDANQNWQPITAQKAYYAPAGTSIDTIVIKNNPDDGSTDRLSIPVAGVPWEIDLFTTEVTGIAVKIQPDSTTPTNIDATAVSGTLCLRNKDLYYSHAVCPAGGGPPPQGADHFANVTIKINNVAIGTLNCVNYAGAPNKCRIVLKT